MGPENGSVGWNGLKLVNQETNSFPRSFSRCIFFSGVWCEELGKREHHELHAADGAGLRQLPLHGHQLNRKTGVYCVLCTVYCVLYTVYCILCTVYCVLCTVYCVLCTSTNVRVCVLLSGCIVLTCVLKCAIVVYVRVCVCVCVCVRVWRVCMCGGKNILVYVYNMSMTKHL